MLVTYSMSSKQLNRKVYLRMLISQVEHNIEIDYLYLPFPIPGSVYCL